MNFWTSCECQMRSIFIWRVMWTSRTIITGQTATLKKFMNALYTAARWWYGVQFRHTGSSDLTFLKMKSGSQWLSLRIGMLRCCNLLLHLHWTIFHNFTKPGFNRMVRHRTLQGNQWQLCENRSVTMSSQDSVTFPGPQDHRICPFVIFFGGGGDYLKNRVYTTQPRTLDELNQRIQDKIRGIPAEILQWTMGNLNDRLKECIRKGGRHLRDVIFRQW